MGKKRYLAYGVVAAILAALVYLQFRTWKDFDWATFWSQGRQLSVRHIVQATALIYFSYFLRALRWKIFLRPVRKEASMIGLIAPTLIGFTGLALLGRPGELIRPYLIARRTDLTFSSQMAAWAIERIFDIAGFTVLMVLAIFLPTELRFLPNPEIYPRLRVGGFLLVALVAGLALVASLVAKFGEAVAAWIETRFAHLASNFGHRVAQKVREFHGGLDTIHSPLSFLQLVRRFDFHVVDHCSGVSRSHSRLWCATRAHDGVESPAIDGFRHAGVVDTVARSGRRFAVGDDFRPPAYFRRFARTVGQLRDSAVGGDVCHRGSGWPAAGAPRTAFFAEAFGRERAGGGSRRTVALASNGLMRCRPCYNQFRHRSERHEVSFLRVRK